MIDILWLVGPPPPALIFIVSRWQINLSLCLASTKLLSDVERANLCFWQSLKEEVMDDFTWAAIMKSVKREAPMSLTRSHYIPFLWLIRVSYDQSDLSDDEANLQSFLVRRRGSFSSALLHSCGETRVARVSSHEKLCTLRNVLCCTWVMLNDFQLELGADGFEAALSLGGGCRYWKHCVAGLHRCCKSICSFYNVCCHVMMAFGWRNSCLFWVVLASDSVVQGQTACHIVLTQCTSLVTAKRTRSRVCKLHGCGGRVAAVDSPSKWTGGRTGFCSAVTRDHGNL